MSIFVNSDYSNYNRLVGVSDNYVVLTNSSYADGTWQQPDEIDVIYQYLTPSILTIEGTRSFTNYQEFERVDITDNDWYRADIPQTLTFSFLLVVGVLFIFNACTRLFRRGGVIFGRD